MNERTLRIISIMNDENMNSTQFAEAIGIKRAAMSHVTGGRNNPSADIISRIIERFPNVNPSWLLSGVGSMKNTPDNPETGYIAVNKNISEANSDDENTTSERKTVDSGKQHDLFYQFDTPIPVTNIESKNRQEDIRKEIVFTDRKSEGVGVNESKIIDKEAEKEVVIYKERAVKTIDKLLIFYSDKTYETFIPEKNEG